MTHNYSFESALADSLTRGLAQSAAGEQRGLTFTRGQVEAWVGNTLTDEELEDIEEVASWSSIPDAIRAIARETLGIEYRESEV